MATKKKNKQTTAGRIVCIILCVVFLLSAVIVGLIGWKTQGFKKDVTESVQVIDINSKSEEIYDMPKHILFTASAASDDEEITTPSRVNTLRAVLEPENTTYRDLTWSIAFFNPSSTWASGKVVTDYIKLTPKDGELCDVRVEKAFSERIILTVSAVENPEIFAECTLDYVKRADAKFFYRDHRIGYLTSNTAATMNKNVEPFDSYFRYDETEGTVSDTYTSTATIRLGTAARACFEALKEYDPTLQYDVNSLTNELNYRDGDKIAFDRTFIETFFGDNWYDKHTYEIVELVFSLRKYDDFFPELEKFYPGITKYVPEKGTMPAYEAFVIIAAIPWQIQGFPTFACTIENIGNYYKFRNTFLFYAYDFDYSVDVTNIALNNTELVF